MRRALIVCAIALACTPASHVTTPVSRAGYDEPLDDAFRARQALNRLTFGARPGDFAAIERMGVSAWVDQQLHPERIQDSGDSVLDRLDITHKTAFELTADHPQINEFFPIVARPADTTTQRMAKADTGSAMAQLSALRTEAETANRRLGLGVTLARSRTAATRELAPSLVLRATLSDRQLLEVMTNFWENHFSVSADRVPQSFTLVDYDHTIRAHALGRFRDLLDAVAHSPAMLYYLDNYQSSVDSLHPNILEWRIEQRRAAHPPFGDTSLVHAIRRRRLGVNENYARELMELHTLGVDGGYTQQDVQEVARCFTGWTVDDVAAGGVFSFQTASHDAGEKVVLGVRIPGGGGVEDGQRVLDILAHHPSTARYIARKLTVHFVSDDPPPALVERAAQTFLRTDGDIREVMRTILTSREFNSRGAYRAKVKTPFELVASILRVMNAAPDTTQEDVQLVAGLGQPIFGRATPDGWPDQASAWMNSGALLNRVNFAAKVGSGQVPGMSIATWRPTQALQAMDAEHQVDALIDAVLAGDASAETRQSLLAVPRQTSSLQHIGDLVSVAIGSSDFQRR